MEEIKHKIGENIRYFRKLKGIAQEQLAYTSDLHPTYISQIERGKKACSIKTLSKIAFALNIPTEKILSNIDTIVKMSQKVKNDTILRKIQLLLNKRSIGEKKACINLIRNFLKNVDTNLKKK
ncbi:MAG: helix-turn-helix transcriptional regulator [Candidatus Firestonebacteria bacterium]